MSNFKFVLVVYLVSAIIVSLSTPVFAAEYNPAVAAGQYVIYGNFVGSGQGVESFNDYAWLKLQVVSVSGKEVTLLSTGQYKNGTATPGNGTINVWNVEAGTDDGFPVTLGPIIAGNLNQGDAVPPPNTYSVNVTEISTYLGVSRTVNSLSVSLSTPQYNTTLKFVYDKLSGMLLDSSTLSITEEQTGLSISEFSYSIIETNLFSSTLPSPTTISLSTTPLPSATATSTQTPLPSPQTPSEGIPIIYIVLAVAVIIVIVVVVALASLARRKKTWAT
jgi:hypothetical protein